MKPGDHPEFFRFPAPPGRSRESQIRLDADGQFWDHGAKVTHPRMQQAFAGWVRRHPDDGRFILSNGYDWTYFTVDATPFFVAGVSGRDGAVWLTLNDGSQEPLHEPLWLRSDVLHTRVKNAQFDARFQPAAQVALGEWLREEAGQYFVGAGTLEIPVLAAPPGEV